MLNRFASITINLGPTFLSGALAANSESHLNKPSCPLIQGPFRHYVLNVLWIFINVLCVALTMYHLYKLYKDLSQSNLETLRVASMVTTMISAHGDEEETRDSRRLKSYIARMELEGIQRVKMFMVITVAYLVFWGPLFLVTLFTNTDYKTDSSSTSHEVTLHVAFVHAFVNPTLFLVLHKGLRSATLDLLCCNLRGGDTVGTLMLMVALATLIQLVLQTTEEDMFPTMDPKRAAMDPEVVDIEEGPKTRYAIKRGAIMQDGMIPPTAAANRTYM